MEPEVETLTVTLTEREKRDLKILAATQGTTMRDIVRGLIREAVCEVAVGRTSK
jgi:hypothetical protein